MVNTIDAMVPAEWRGTFDVLTLPVRWIPEWSATLVNLAWYGGSTAEVALKRTLLLLPILLVIVGIYATMASLYTLPFRSGRGGFLTAVLMAWWDAGRTVWLFWAGLGRLVVALGGWIWSLFRFALSAIKNAIVSTFRSPLALLDWTSRRYFQPGVPWLAFAVLLLWSCVEATIFTFTLRPTMTEVLAGLTGFEPDPRFMAPMLWIFLFFLVAGSFACVQVLSDAVRQRKTGEMVQMLLVEFFVMFFEVIFLYRELVDAVTPWIAQQSGGQLHLGLGATLALASFGWMGVRGMTWFLFGRFGTPALLAILSRQTLTQDQPSNVVQPPMPDLWKGPIAALKAESAFFQAESRRLFELMTLPVLQLLAAAINFPVVAVQSRPAFTLPFKDLDDMLAAAPFGRAADTARGPMRTPVEGMRRVAS